MAGVVTMSILNLVYVWLLADSTGAMTPTLWGSPAAPAPVMQSRPSTAGSQAHGDAHVRGGEDNVACGRESEMTVCVAAFVAGAGSGLAFLTGSGLLPCPG
jgi:hypothetical protein